MLSKTVFISGLCCVASAASQPSECTAAFAAFVDKFGRRYSSKDEEAHRFAIFKEKCEFVGAENAKNHSYTLEINEFADQTMDEFGAARLGLTVPTSKGKWGSLPHLGTDKYSGAVLPKSVDWTKNGAVTPVKNQKQCGSCWAFSTTGAVEGAWKLASGRLLSLSEQQLVDCSKDGNQGCGGGSMEAGFQFLHNTAMCTEQSYEYTARDGKCHQKKCKIGIPKGALKGFKTVAPNNELALREAVSKQPVSVAIEADQMSFQLYHGGVLTKKCGTTLDHGVLLVGYGTDHGVEYWNVKNSWGPAWGEKGYIRLERGSPSKKSGECGIQRDASYPVLHNIPGPSPGPPSPPSPPNPPSPPPAPAPTNYEEPPCRSHEVEARFPGLNGVLCAPPCRVDDNSCPSDVPIDTAAHPECVLRDRSGTPYCALVCHADTDCPKDAFCAHNIANGQGSGLCLYPDEMASSGALTFHSSSSTKKTKGLILV